MSSGPQDPSEFPGAHEPPRGQRVHRPGAARPGTATGPAPGELERGDRDGDDDPDIVPLRPVEAAHETAPRGPLALLGTFLIGLAMGAADVAPGFSGGTVALVAGIYERFVANVRQGAHVLSLLIRGRPQAALRAWLSIEWPFVAALLAGIGTAIVVLSATIGQLLDRYPRPMAAVFLGLVLGATVVAQRELRSPGFHHALIAIVVGVLVFIGLGWSPGIIEDPSLLMIFGAAAVAVCAMILPGVSGAFLLLVLGMYTAVFTEGFGERDLLVMLTVVLGAATGLALFSTALNYLLRRWHDLILAVLLGLMLGSARVLWPWPDGMDSTDMGPPIGNEGLLAFSVGLAAFAVVWLLALIVPSSKEASTRRGRITPLPPPHDPATPEWATPDPAPSEPMDPAGRDPAPRYDEPAPRYDEPAPRYDEPAPHHDEREQDRGYPDDLDGR